jgi:glutamine amidotransferase
VIAVVNYGVGNVGSIFSMLRKIGVTAVEASTPDDVVNAERILLPGVGAFDHGMSMLAERELIDPLRDQVRRGTPLLGICLGMQLLAEASEEGTLAGLGVIGGSSVRFRSESAKPVKVPHMGWNEISITRTSPLTVGLEERPRFYFVHSYHLRVSDNTEVLATAQHGIEFAAIIRRENVWGAQFHPEKSHRFGMRLLANFSQVRCSKLV